MPVELEKAVLGGKIRVPTIDGAVALTIPAWSSSGAVFRVREKGLPKKSGGKGDIFAVLSITLPDKPDSRLVELIEAVCKTDRKGQLGRPSGSDDPAA